MNVVLIVCDTLRRDHVGAYGATRAWSRRGRDESEPFICTPHIDDLASQGTRFDRFYASSYPTIPCRFDLATGKAGFPTRGWEPLRPEDVTIQDTLGEAGILTMLIFDPPPLGNDEYNFTRGFTGWEWARGQHRDRWATDPAQVTLPAARYKLKSPSGLELYLRNSAHRHLERDWMPMKTAELAESWLERNAGVQNFFLWVDMWDPHEPFDAPPYDLEQFTDPAYGGEEVIYPRYGRVDYLSADELNNIRARYAANVRLVDRAVGRIVCAVDRLGIRDRTVVILTTDHGHLFGEHGLQGKPTGPLGSLYEPTVHIPLIVSDPRVASTGGTVAGLYYHPDLHGYILEASGLARSRVRSDGPSLARALSGEPAGREHVYSGRYSRGVSILKAGGHGSTASTFDGWAGFDSTSEPLTVTSEDGWALLCPPRWSGSPQLFCLESDPGQQTNLFDDERGRGMELVSRLLGFLREHNAEESRVDAYAWNEGPLPVTEGTGMPAESAVWVVRIEGVHYGFLDQREAETASASGSSPLKQELGSLTGTDLNTLICIGDQYYRPSDIPVWRR